MQNDIIIGMTSTIENRDSNTGGHIQRTSDVINIFVNYLLANSKFSEINKEYWQNLIKAAPLHDSCNLGPFLHPLAAKTGLCAVRRLPRLIHSLRSGRLRRSSNPLSVCTILLKFHRKISEYFTTDVCKIRKW